MQTSDTAQCIAYVQCNIVLKSCHQGFLSPYFTAFTPLPVSAPARPNSFGEEPVSGQLTVNLLTFST